jgi:hypothetical protein
VQLSLCPSAGLCSDFAEMHRKHMARMAETWQALLGKDQTLKQMQEQHSGKLTDMRMSWNARLDELETCTTKQLKDLESKLSYKRKKQTQKRRDPAMMQQLLNALL